MSCRPFAPLITFALLVVVAGCGGGPTTTEVQGKITYKGAPVTFGLINFQPTGGKPLGGEIGADGSYKFSLPPGDYQVRIDSPSQTPAIKEGEAIPKTPPKPTPRQVPAEFSQYATSGLTASVKDQSEPQTIDFALP